MVRPYSPQSMSGKGNCFENAVTESFFATAEKEYLEQISLKTIKETRTEFLYYIEGRTQMFRSLSPMLDANVETGIDIYL